jgi:hypothetical protein
LLATRANVRIHIPHVVVQEFLTSQHAAVDDDVQAAIAAIKKARNRLGPNDRGMVDEASTKLSSAAAGAKTRFTEAFESWCKEHRVVVGPIEPHHGANVMKAYFAGAPPFTALKERDDLPDAFVLEALRDVTSTGEVVIFITADKALRDAADSVARATYSSIEDLLKEQEIVAFLRRGILESQMEALALAIDEVLFEGPRVAELIKAHIATRMISIYFPVDGVASITDVLSVDGIWPGDQLTYFGDGLIGVPFSARATCLVNLVLPADSPALAEARPDQTVVWREDGTAELRLRRTFVLVGSILVAVSPQILETEAKRPAVVEEVEKCETVLDEVKLEDAASGARPLFEELLPHAIDEAERQVAAGDLESHIDEREDALLTDRAQWFDIPKYFHGKHGDITVLPTARVKIRPMGRFEVLVDIAKQTTLREKAEDGATTQEPGG